MAEDVPNAAAGELAELVKETTTLQRKILERIDDVAALLLSMRLVALEAPADGAPADPPAARVWDISPDAIAGYGAEDFLLFAVDHVSLPHQAADCGTCTEINKRRAAV